MADFEQQEERLRQPPQSQDAEQAVLAGVLLDGEMWDRVAGRVEAVDFYSRAHQLIFQAMEAVSARSQPLDIVTVADALRERGELENTGGTAYLASLADAFGTAQNVVAYADIACAPEKQRRHRAERLFPGRTQRGATAGQRRTARL